MAMSWHTMLEFEPPLIGCVISNRDFTFGMLNSTKECAINIPTVEMARKVVGCGNSSGKNTDKFSKFCLTKSPGTKIKAPLIQECYANLECKVIDKAMVKKYNFFVLEVMNAWIDPEQKNPKTLHHRGKGTFMVAGRTIRLRSMMK